VEAVSKLIAKGAKDTLRALADNDKLQPSLQLKVLAALSKRGWESWRSRELAERIRAAISTLGDLEDVLTSSGDRDAVRRLPTAILSEDWLPWWSS
jgi:hypothetical protein